VAQIGYDRAMAYVMSGNDQNAIRRAVRDAGLPSDTSGRVLQLTVDTGARALEIHYDNSLTVDQKRAALIALQRTVVAQLDTILPPAAQRLLPGDGLPWVKALGQGSYNLAMPSLMSTSGYVVVSIAAPPPPKRFVSPLLLPRTSGPSAP
jgi:hypothetical protein